MKSLLLFAVLITSCHSVTKPNEPAASLDFAPGGKFYVEPGSFEGIWIEKQASNNDTQNCRATISQADSILTGQITNLKTNEVLTVFGHHYDGINTSTPHIPLEHTFQVFDSSTVGDKAGVNILSFFTTTDTLAYVRSNGTTRLSSIFCLRKK